MKVLKIIGILLLLVIVLALVASLLLPKKMEVERELKIDAPIGVVWKMVNRLDSQESWSPWFALDPEMKSEYEGTDGQPGAIHRWESDHKELGKGEHELMTVDAENYRTESTLRFFEPWEGEASAYIQLEETEDGKTLAKWGVTQKTPIGVNLLMTLMNVKGGLAKRFDDGLETLNAKSQALAIQAEMAPSWEIRTVERAAQNYVGKKTEMSFDSLHSYFGMAMPALYQMGDELVDKSQPPLALYFSWKEDVKMTETTAAMVWIGDAAPEGMEVYTVDTGTCLVIDYYGAYEGLGEAHEAMGAYMEKNGYTLRGPVIEEYVTDPESEPDAGKRLTRVVYPVSK